MSEALRRLQAAIDPEAWGAPDLSSVIDGGSRPPTFPRPVLGKFWAQWCADAADGANAPFDYTALGLLVTAASLIGNSRLVSAVRGGSWRESPIIWGALVGPPACGKTPALAPLFAVVDDIEEHLAAGFEATQRRHQAELEEGRANGSASVRCRFCDA